MKIIIYIIVFSAILFSKGISREYKSYSAYQNINLNKKQERFYIQIGAFKNKKYALLVAKKLRRIYPTKIIKKQVGRIYYYKLLIGSYQSRKEAELVKKTLPRKYEDTFILWER
ncbi:hypothetical protein MNB_SV-13-2083 [hydrothermal vent metagenome]|uniref:SPOR domain-containing protein n=1 Tax=hydrothermal vent metagenome TaxID=652676 RepID=A0A1W1CE82_9ZZZZ